MSNSNVEDLTGKYILDPTNTRLGLVARHAMVTRVHDPSRRSAGGRTLI
jgi:hypothetical protein